MSSPTNYYDLVNESFMQAQGGAIKCGEVCLGISKNLRFMTEEQPERLQQIYSEMLRLNSELNQMRCAIKNLSA